MYCNEFKNKNAPAECGVCHREHTNYISNFRIDVNGANLTLILGNDIFVSEICADCLTKTIGSAIAQVSKKKIEEGA